MSNDQKPTTKTAAMSPQNCGTPSMCRWPECACEDQPKRSQTAERHAKKVSKLRRVILDKRELIEVLEAEIKAVEQDIADLELKSR